MPTRAPTPFPGAYPCWLRAESRPISRLGLLRRGPQPPALLLIQQEAQRMGMLVSDLLDLARNDAGRLHLRCQPLLADDVLLELHERMAPQASGRLRLQACATAPRANADPHRLQQCLTALVDNALLYSDGPVTLAASMGPSGELVLHVIDRGPGSGHRGARGDLWPVRARHGRPGQPPPRLWHRPLGGAPADRSDGRPRAGGCPARRGC